MLVVISIGGSIFAKDLKINAYETFISYANVLIKLSEKHKLVIVTGGGSVARDYIRLAREVGANEALCDYIGIDVTRLNAKILISALGCCAYPDIPLTYSEVKTALLSKDIVVMGGVSPGHSTDAVSALTAEYIDADLLLIATATNGIYSADPNVHSNAVKFDEISIKDLLNVINSIELKAGSKSPVDILAVKIIERCNLKTIVMDGSNPEVVMDTVIDELKEEENSKQKLLFGTRIRVE